MFYTNIFCGKNWRHEDYEFYSIWPVQNGSIGPVLCRWLLHAVSRKMRTQQTGDCCVIVGTGLLNNSQYAHLNNIQRRTTNYWLFFFGIWAFYTDFWHRFWSGMHPICCSGIRQLAETPLLISININYEMKLPYAKPPSSTKIPN